MSFQCIVCGVTGSAHAQSAALEAAVLAKSMGVTVIGVTSSAFTHAVAPRNKLGLRLIDVADAVAKSADVTLFRLHLAMAVGGKGFVLLTGDIASVEAAVAAGSQVAADDGILVGRAVIAAPTKELFREFV